MTKKVIVRRATRTVLLSACVMGVIGQLAEFSMPTAQAQGVPAARSGPATPQSLANPSIPMLPPIDPQRVRDQDDMTWDDYKGVPGVDWTDPERKGAQKTIRVATILADFEDQPFVITLPKQSDALKNPQTDPIKREDVPQYYVDFWNGRNEAHHGHTANEYWMEQSHGRIGVTMTKFGPYRMPKKLFQYGLTEWGARNYGPTGFAIDGNVSRDCDALWTADAGANIRRDFDLVLRMFAGYDETGVWQEFGEMKFQTRDDITAEFGNPDPTKPRWAPTRYVPWTSWRAAQGIWSNAAILNSESSGAIIHEISHAAFRIGDNNNNPYVTPYRRVGSGPWDIMDRGSFNGPGGPHQRWEVPPTHGGSMPAGLMLRQKINFKFVAPENVMTLSREGLAKSGLAVGTIMSRSADPGATGLAGISVRLDGTPVSIPEAALQGARGRGRGAGGGRGTPATQEGGAAVEGAADGRGDAPAGAGGGGGMYPISMVGGGGTGAGGAGAATEAATDPAGGGAGRAAGGGRGGGGGGGGRGGNGVPGLPAGTTNDRAPWEDPATHPLSQGLPTFTHYTLEVVQRIGYDSFCPDNGVLIAKNKDSEGSNGGVNSYNCFNWVIDAHPEDINKLDFKRPNGEPVMRTLADYRQLNDALFHAGLNSGSQYEWEDTPNRLHFYIIDMKKDEKGFLNYTIAVRSLDGSGPQTRDVKLAGPAGNQAVRTPLTPCEVTLTNTGRAAETEKTLHPQDATAYLNSDVYRLEATVEGRGWNTQLQSALAAVKFGDSQKVPVYVSHEAGSAGTATVTLKATSESDPKKSTTTKFTVSAN